MKTIPKSQLPRKNCPICQRPFVWRKKWAKDWDLVIYCSERCRRHPKKNLPTGQPLKG